MIFVDFEVFRYDWLVVFIDSKDWSKTIICNNVDDFKSYYSKNKEELFIGYNIRGYDQYIFKALLLDIDPYKISKYIVGGNKGWQYSDLFNTIELYHFDIKTTLHSLKELEGFMGNSIQESNISFDTENKLSEIELKEVIDYCVHDVEQTIEVFFQRSQELSSQLQLIQMFNLPKNYISKSKAQISASILNATKIPRNDEFLYSFPDTLLLEKYSYIVDWFCEATNKHYEAKLETEIGGIPHIVGWGGLHGAIEKYIGEGIILCCDVASLYPALMIEYNLLSRNVADPKKYREIRDLRLELKKKKDPKQECLKIVLNSTYGASKYKFNNLYDPLMANNVCIYGQLLLVDLISKLENHWKLVQSNTDGLIGLVKNREDIEKIKAIAKEWEKRTRLDLEWEEASKIIQKDVNTYILIKNDGSYKSKGSYVKKLHKLDNDLPIVNKAIVDFFIKGIPVEKTILECDELIMFQKINKLTYKYSHALYGDAPLKEKCLRTFASTKHNKGVFKVKVEDGSISKIPNTADCCFIDNSNIINKKCPDYLNKQWYIDLANERIRDFYEKT